MRLPVAVKRALKRPVYDLFERGWALALALARPLVGGPARVRTPPADAAFEAGQRVMAVAPHPDDETLGCGGTLARHARAGDAVTIVLATDGRRSRAGGLGPVEMAARRAREAAEATAQLGGPRLVALDFPEDDWDETLLADRLVPLLAELRPTLIYAPSCVDYHPEHVKVARAVAAALERAGSAIDAGCRLRVYEVQVPLTPTLANVVVDITETQAAKQAALRCYATQQGSLVWVPRQARYHRVLYQTTREVEPFWELSPAEYVRLMRAAPLSPSPAFWPLRDRPLSDGLAYLVGQEGRRRLKRDVHAS